MVARSRLTACATVPATCRCARRSYTARMTTPYMPSRLAPIAHAIAQLGTHALNHPVPSNPQALLGDALQRAAALQQWLGESVSGRPLAGDFRTRAAAVSFGVAQEHQRGIVDMLRGTPPNYSSALTLVRPQFDAYVRGMWLALCATEPQLERFSAGGEIPHMQAMIEAIDKVPGGGVWNAVRKIYDDWWGEMSGLTHTGVQHLARWSSGPNLEPAADPLELVGLVDFASRIALLSTAGIALLVTDVIDVQALLAEGRRRLPPRRPRSASSGGQAAVGPKPQ